MTVCPSVRTLRHGLTLLAGLLLLTVANIIHSAYGQSTRPQPNYSTDPLDPFPLPPELVGVNRIGK